MYATIIVLKDNTTQHDYSLNREQDRIKEGPYYVPMRIANVHWKKYFVFGKDVKLLRPPAPEAKSEDIETQDTWR